MKSVTNIVASNEGMKASIFASCWCAKGNRAARPAIVKAETASVIRMWVGVAVRSTSDLSVSPSLMSGKIEAF